MRLQRESTCASLQSMPQRLLGLPLFMQEYDFWCGRSWLACPVRLSTNFAMIFSVISNGFRCGFLWTIARAISWRERPMTLTRSPLPWVWGDCWRSAMDFFLPSSSFWWSPRMQNWRCCRWSHFRSSCSWCISVSVIFTRPLKKFRNNFLRSRQRRRKIFQVFGSSKLMCRSWMKSRNLMN